MNSRSKGSYFHPPKKSEEGEEEKRHDKTQASKQVKGNQAWKQYQSPQQGAPAEKTRAGVATKTQM